jgi:glucose/arabinose dehydrogenase
VIRPAVRLLRLAVLATTVAATAFSASPAAATTPTIALSLVTSGLSNPVLAIGPNDGTGRLFIVEQPGRIRIVKGGSLLPTPFLDISSLVSTGGEQGLLGLAFHPQFATNHQIYVNYTDRTGATNIRSYKVSTANPDLVDPTSAKAILTIKQPYSNHNGGNLAFGPDGFLYIGMGDGGSGGDPGNRAQNTGQLLGKMLRIDVNHTSGKKLYANPATNPYVGIAGADEVWQIGLRNPWRFSFDSLTGALWIGDVGQSGYEEVDVAPQTSTGPGRGINWGWRQMEGFHCYNPATGCVTAGKSLPLLEYTHVNGRCAITGGYVYRGSAIPSLAGTYLYADYCTGEIWGVSATATSPATSTLLLDTPLYVSSFGQDAAGELYVVDLGGSVYKVVGG